MGTTIQSHCPDTLPSSAEPLLSTGSPSLSGSASKINIREPEIAQGRHKKQTNLRTLDESYRHVTSIGMLPDDVLLGIFDFYRKNQRVDSLVGKWQVLAHVCQRWRQIVFSSSRRLKLLILCTHRTPVRKDLGIWPAFPIALSLGRTIPSPFTPSEEDNVTTALQHSDRVCFVKLDVTGSGSQLRKVATVMQKPFPLLTYLDIASDRCAPVLPLDLSDRFAPALPANFFGGSAPCLRVIILFGIPYPALPKLLFSTSGLVTLILRDIPPTGYISPETMVSCLARLPSLESYIIEFQEAIHRPDRIRPPPVTRAIIPALTYFQFRGCSEYLEELVARIDGLQVNRIEIYYLNQLVNFHVPQLSKFIDYSIGPRLTPPGSAHVGFLSDRVIFTLHRHANYPGWYPTGPGATISFEAIDWQISRMAQALGQFSATLFSVVHLETQLEIGESLDSADGVEWLHFLDLFPAVEMLFITRGLASFAALALEGITGEMVAEVLPSLDSICLEGQPASSVEKFEFVAARRLSDHPVTIVDTREEFHKRLDSYISK